MNIQNFLGKIEKIVMEIDNMVDELDKTEYIEKAEIKKILSEISQIMEIWLYFISEMRNADEQLIVNLCKDIAEAGYTQDRIRLTDVLLFGLRELLVEYYVVIKEAVDGE